ALVHCVVPLRNQYKPKSATTCGSRIKDDNQTMSRHRFAFLTLPQQCGTIQMGTLELPKSEKTAILTFVNERGSRDGCARPTAP
ncbi:hypothetical protein QUS64_22515, partial [Xanthomonas citri pv. citri]